MNSHKTAITRNGPSAPARWLSENVKLADPMLDYGCGKGSDAEYFGCHAYDPHYFPKYTYRGRFRTIICIYVLNTVYEDAHEGILNVIRDLLLPDGVAYIAVRNDKRALRGVTNIGTYQCVVNLDLPVLVENSSFKIYKLEK